MAPSEIVDAIRTARLELVHISPSFARALVDGDRRGAGSMIDAVVSESLARDPAHVVQLTIAEAAPRAPHGGSRVVVLLAPPGRRRAIGSVGFHGPPDDRGRLELGCRISSPYRGRGYAGEAMAAMFEWAATRLGITRFLVAVASPAASEPRLMTELELSGHRGWADRVVELERVLDPGT